MLIIYPLVLARLLNASRHSFIDIFPDLPNGSANWYLLKKRPFLPSKSCDGQIDLPKRQKHHLAQLPRTGILVRKAKLVPRVDRKAAGRMRIRRST